MKKIILICVCIAVLAIGGCMQNAGPDYAKACAEKGGKWLAAYNECEDLSESACNDLNGSFDGCASACRHDPNAQVCTMQCVQVCKI